MNQLFARSLLVAALASAAGCSLIIEGATQCKTEKDCKGGAQCVEGVCVQAEPPDASTPVPPDAGTPDAGPTGLVLVVTGPSTTPAGTDLKLTVTAKDPSGATLTGYTGTVELTSSDLEATLPAQYTFDAVTDNGSHDFTVVLRTAGSQTVTATDSAVSAAGRATVAVTGAEATSFSVDGLVSPFTAGTKGSVTVTAKDAFGNVATGYVGSVALTSDDAQAVLPAAYAFVAGDNGTHTFTDAVELRSAGTRSVTATDAAASISGKQSGIAVVAAAGASLTVEGIKTPLEAGAATSVTVSANDAFGNLATGYAGRIHFTSTDAKATLPADYQFTASDRGVKIFADGVVLRSPGKVNVVATDLADSSIAGAQNDIDVQVGPAARLAFVASPLGAEVNKTMGSVQVAVQDAAGNTVTTSTATVAIAQGQGPSATLSGTTSRDAVSGIATFDDLVLDTEGTGFTLKATSGSLASAESAPFDVNHCSLGYTGPTCTDCIPSYHHPTGQLAVCSDGCHDPEPACDQPPAKTCEGSVSVSYAATGSCALDAAAPYYKCNYAEAGRVDCAGNGQVCDVATGACVASPCKVDSCPTVKAPECSADKTTLQAYTVQCVPVTSTTFNCVDKALTPEVCTPLKVCLTGACTTVATPAANDLLITEVLDESSTDLPTAKWFEIRNLAGVQLDLAGLKVEETTGAKSFTLPATPQVVAVGGRYVVAGSLDPAQNGGVAAADAAFSGGFTVPAGSGHLRILSGTTLLEELAWDATFPRAKGVAMNLSSRVLVKGANAHPWFWCPASSYVTGSSGDRGTPGLANGDCGKTAAPAVTWCASPLMSQPVLPATATKAFGQVRGASLTDFTTTGNDLYPLLVGEFGYGPTVDSTGWTWAAASPDTAWAPANSTDDQYSAGVTFATAGTYHWGFRFGLKDAATGTVTAWTYCGASAPVADRTLGPWQQQVVCPVGYKGATCADCEDGYHHPTAQPTVCADACHDPDPCAVAKAAECRGNTSVTFSATGVCTTNGTAPDYHTCAYTETPVNCTGGEFCKASTGLCVNPCATPCPSADFCDADDVTLHVFTTTCEPVDADNRNCASTPAGTQDCSAEGKVCFAGKCDTVPAPVSADLIVSEVHASPTGATAEESKWIELTNISAHPVDLAGLTIEEVGAGKSFTLPATPQLVAAGGRYVVGGSANTSVNGGVTVDHAWDPASFTIAKTAGHLRISAGATVLEELTWDDTFPMASGVAMNLSSRALVKGANAYQWFWCNADAFIPGSTTDKGTPGASNFDCGKPAPSLNWCVAQHLDATVATNVAATAYGRVHGPGLTDFNTSGNDRSPLLVGEFGYGPNDDPDATGMGWTWISAAPNPGWAPSGGLDAGRDELQASVTFSSAGTYSWAYRFAMKDPVTLNRGPWQYCDSAGVATAPTAGTWPTVVVTP